MTPFFFFFLIFLSSFVPSELPIQYPRGIIGAMDGSHIKIDSPSPKIAIPYYSYKQYTSMVLLGVVGLDGCFYMDQGRITGRVQRRRDLAVFRSARCQY